MLTSSTSLSEADVVLKLRAAGCVFAEDEARLLFAAATSAEELLGMVDRRVAGTPLEYVLGWAEFFGLRIAVDPTVFVPRRRTEFLVRQAISLGVPGALVVDLCCGSGAVGVAIASGLDRAVLHASDVDPAAVRCARRNLLPVGGRVHEGDLYDSLPDSLRGHVDILAVNAPYVPTDAIALMPPEARLYEARVALDGGVEGIDVQRRVAATAQQWLTPSGHLLIETSEQQAALTRAACAEAGLLARAVESDDGMGTTVVIATG
ncbi:MAG: putative protein N(5)-glutamine methyltransferase [Jatrophihabitans sp.]